MFLFLYLRSTMFCRPALTEPFLAACSYSLTFVPPSFCRPAYDSSRTRHRCCFFAGKEYKDVIALHGRHMYPTCTNCMCFFACPEVGYCGGRNEHLLNSQSSKPGAGKFVAMHVMPTAWDFFLTNFYPSGPFICIFSPKPLLSFSCLGYGQHRFLCGPAE